MRKFRKMTVDEAKELLAVRRGADIFGYLNAKHLRLIQREVNPKYVDICKAMNPPENGAKQQPYFGAIATPAGIVAAKKVLKEVRSGV